MTLRPDLVILYDLKWSLINTFGSLLDGLVTITLRGLIQSRSNRVLSERWMVRLETFAFLARVERFGSAWPGLALINERIQWSIMAPGYLSRLVRG